MYLCTKFISFLIIIYFLQNTREILLQTTLGKHTSCETMTIMKKDIGLPQMKLTQ